MNRICKAAVLFAVVASFSACKVDERYSSDNIKDVDTDVSLFENGLEIPLIKNTLELRIDSLLNDIDVSDSLMKYLVVGEDGKYHISFDGAESLDSLIDSFGLDSIMKIEGISFDSPFSFNLGDLTEDKLSSPSQAFGQEISLPDFSSVQDLSIDPVKLSLETGSGLAGQDYDIDVDIDPISVSMVLCSQANMNQLAGIAEMSGISSVPIPGDGLELDIDPYMIAAFEKPDKIKTLKSITLGPDARIAVTVSVSPNILSEGSITPAIQADLSDFLIFEGGSGILDLGTLSLNPDNNFSATNHFSVTGLNITKLFDEKTVSFNGSVGINCVAQTSKAKAATEDLKVNISIALENFSFDSVVCEIDTMEASVSETMDIVLPEIELPAEVNGIDWVSFTDASNITIDISAVNIDKVSGLSLKGRDIKITFPPELQVSGPDISGNVLSVSEADIVSGLHREVKLSKITLPSPAGGKVKYSAKAKVEASCTASGTIDTKDLESLDGEDISFNFNVSSDIDIKDFSVRTNDISKPIPTVSGDASFDIPGEAATYGTFTITPVGTPKISIVADIPDLGDLSISAGNGIKVQLPGFIKFGTVATSPNYSFNPENNTLNLSKVVSQSIDLPIESVVITPERVGDGYKVVGSYEIEGGVTIPATTIGRSTLDKISKAKVSFDASIPELKAATIAVDSLSFAVDEKVVFNIGGLDQTPDMIEEIGQVLLDDVFASLSFDVEGLPSVGSGRYIVDIKTLLPDFIVPNVIPIQGEIKDGKFRAEPIGISGLDFSGRDINELASADEGIKDSIRVRGRIYAENPTVDIRSLSATVDANVKANISDDDGNIGLKSLSARVDYQLDTLFTIAFPEIPDVLSEINLDLPNVTAILGIGSNLGLPVEASAYIAPLKNGVEETAKGVFINDLRFPYSENPSVKDTVTNTLNLNLDPIINSKADSIHVGFSVKTDPARFITFYPASDYTLNIGYNIDAPVELGEEFYIEYCDTVEISDAASYIEEVLPATACMIGGTVINSTPLGVSLEVEFLAYNSADNTYRLIDIDKIKTDIITAGKEADFSLKIGPARDADLSGVSHARFSVKVSSNGEALKPESGISVKNVYFGIPEGVSIKKGMFD